RPPAEFEPVAWPIADWNGNYKLGLISDGAVGDGKLLVPAFDVTKPHDANPVARQLRHSLLSYMASDCFQPRIPLSVGQIRRLLFDTRIMKDLGATAQINGESASTVIDGDPTTFELTSDPQAPFRDTVERGITCHFPL